MKINFKKSNLQQRNELRKDESVCLRQAVYNSAHILGIFTHCQSSAREKLVIFKRNSIPIINTVGHNRLGELSEPLLDETGRHMRVVTHRHNPVVQTSFRRRYLIWVSSYSASGTVEDILLEKATIKLFLIGRI